MTSPLAIVTRTAGTNCDAEAVRALELAGARVELLHIQQLLDDPARLQEAGLCIFPGGFSYGDDIAAGRVLGLELRHGMYAELRSFIDAGGLVLGICNGFQVLIESGILDPPSSESLKTGDLKSAAGREIALHANASNRFECRWVGARGRRDSLRLAQRRAKHPMPSSARRGPLRRPR